MAENNQLEQMKQKYNSVLEAVKKNQVQLNHLHIQDNKLYMEGMAPSEEAKNKVWDQIKAVNPNWSQELIADITIDPNARLAQGQAHAAAAGDSRSYTVQAGDSLSKISKQFYGDPNQYNKIFEANRDLLNDPNKIHPGQTLKIPS